MDKKDLGVARRLARGLTMLGVGASLVLGSVVATAPVAAAGTDADPDAVAPAVLEVEHLDGQQLTGAELAKFLEEDRARLEAEPDAAPDDTATDETVAASRRDKIVSIARKEIGTKEKPPGSNCQKYSKRCVSWCSLFSTWVWRKAGVDIPQYAFTGDVYKWGQRHKKAYGKSKLRKLAKGDSLLLGTGPSKPSTSKHIGIVEKFDLKKGKVTLIEGNASNQVKRVTRALSSKTFYGGVRP
ncbi:CHAP domain-containing protein [Streptoalloteichus hindustanus]|uniref:CHAP domain-containing protein n=1 Tax=Streptoalloteichus hindustanus TaxID=2017 RepID=A0A1M4Z336_STRHI|nr:CHAP domain-containing protein [Streptoalloteichus hindustanus]SHF12479.1 CHAP domain-containing protein [Streptoalloteichus hindustanus]